MNVEDMSSGDTTIICSARRSRDTTYAIWTVDTCIHHSETRLLVEAMQSRRRLGRDTSLKVLRYTHKVYSEQRIDIQTDNKRKQLYRPSKLFDTCKKASALRSFKDKSHKVDSEFCKSDKHFRSYIPRSHSYKCLFPSEDGRHQICGQERTAVTTLSNISTLATTPHAIVFSWFFSDLSLHRHRSN
jgi:hypothetical protein